MNFHPQTLSHSTHENQIAAMPALAMDLQVTTIRYRYRAHQIKEFRYRDLERNVAGHRQK